MNSFIIQLCQWEAIEASGKRKRHLQHQGSGSVPFGRNIWRYLDFRPSTKPSEEKVWYGMGLWLMYFYFFSAGDLTHGFAHISQALSYTPTLGGRDFDKMVVQ